MKFEISNLKSPFLLCLLCALSWPIATCAQIFSDVDFLGDVNTSSWSAISGITAGIGTNGYYTTGTHTNYYRLSGTNLAGRIPLSTNVIVVFVGSTNGTTNAVCLTWPRKPGVIRHVVEKSYDAGTSWTNWLSVGPTTTNWTDTGSNTWTATVFTNAFPAITGQSLPWVPAARIAFTAGYFDVVNSTQLVFVANGVTNTIDADITTP